MPRYEYKCRKCGIEFQISHSIHDKLTDCEDCTEKGSLFRLITDFTTTGIGTSYAEKKQKPGKIVNEFIKDAKNEVNEYKKNINKSLVNVEDVSE